MKKKPEIKKEERQECEVYSRVVGYLRPVNQWNEGKREEFDNRKEYSFEKTKTSGCSC